MFRFSMQTALDVRGKQEKVKMKELAEKLAVQTDLEQGIDEIDQGLIESDQHMNQAKQAGLINLSTLRQIEGYKQRMHIQRSRLEVQLSEAKGIADAKRMELIDAARKRRTLEILSEREESRFYARLERLERAFTDETATNQFVQQQRQA